MFAIISYGIINKLKEDYMKKSTINRILIGIIAFLILTICVLIIQIINRPRYTADAEPQTATIVEIPISEAMPSTLEPESEESTVSDSAPTTLRGKSSAKVNIRELPSEDARVLQTIEAETEFQVLEILDSGWVKIQYADITEAYISSSFVILLD